VIIVPRQKRQESPTGYYHIMMRGINKEMIFRSDDFKSSFMEILSRKLEETEIEVAAYCIMDNHVHLVLKGELIEIGILLKRVNTTFAMKLNSRMDRVGHVFQDRYKSQEVLSDEHLLQVVRYVHNNPVNAGITRECKGYSWSSYNGYISGNLGILAQGQYDLILELSGSIESFKAFHRLDDEGEYLDTKEEMEQLKYIKAQKIISEFCESKGVSDVRQLTVKPYLMDSLIEVMIHKSNLSLRKIADMLEVSRNMVQESAKKQNGRWLN
jgi:REP element-mobilizing transposase RayT/predicted XRE-type DNA-binding protein